MPAAVAISTKNLQHGRSCHPASRKALLPKSLGRKNKQPKDIKLPRHISVYDKVPPAYLSRLFFEILYCLTVPLEPHA